MKRFLIHVSTYWCGMDYMYPQNFGNHEYASWSECLTKKALMNYMTSLKGIE